MDKRNTRLNPEHICTLVAQLVERTPTEEIRLSENEREKSFRLTKLAGTEYALEVTKKPISSGYYWYELQLFQGEVDVFKHHQEEKTRDLGRVVDNRTFLGEMYRQLEQRYVQHVRQLRENLVTELEAAVGILVDRETVGEG